MACLHPPPPRPGETAMLVAQELLPLEDKLEALFQNPDAIRTARRARLVNGWFEEAGSARWLKRWALSGWADELAEASVEVGSMKCPHLGSRNSNGQSMSLG